MTDRKFVCKKCEHTFDYYHCELKVIDSDDELPTLDILTPVVCPYDKNNDPEWEEVTQ